MTDFKTALINDPRLAQITDQQVFAVRQGASNNTFQTFSAVSASSSGMIFNVQLPSESVVLSRDISLRASLTVSFKSGNEELQYIENVALAPFPMAMGMQSISSQINNSTVSLNLADILPQLLCMNDIKDINKYQGTCPTLRDDVYFDYNDAQDVNNDPFGAMGSSGLEQFPESRGAYVIDSFVRSAEKDGANLWTYTLKFTVTEPIFLSPFIFGNPQYNLGGFVGINTLNLNCQFTSQPNRVFRVRNLGEWDIEQVSWGAPNNNDPFQGKKPVLLLNFLSSQSTQLIPSRQVLPYADFPRYITPYTAKGAGDTITLANIQLNQLPDKFIIAVRKKMSMQNPKDSDSFWTIDKVTVNLNNQSGLLSSAEPESLWRLSQEAGSQQSWTEFRGTTQTRHHPDMPSDKTEEPKYEPAPAIIQTIGSLLVLDPAMALSLPPMISSGSIGQFSFNISIQCHNNAVAKASGTQEVEAVVICMNSGIMVNAAGSSAIYTGILTKEMTIATATESDVPPMDVPEYERMVGGKTGNYGALKKMLSSKLGKMMRSGGAVSGGAHSGGVRRFV